MTWPHLSAERVSEYLGRAITDDDRGSVASLNDLDPEIVRTIRAWHPMRRRMYAMQCLEFLIPSERTNAVSSFLEQVLLADAEVDHRSWRRGAALQAPIPELHTESTATIRILREALDGLQGRRYFRLRSTSKRGATHNDVGVLADDWRYWEAPRLQRPLARVTVLVFDSLSPSTDVEEVSPERLDSALMRALVRSMAHRTRRRLEAGATSADELLRTLLRLPDGSPLPEPTDDASQGGVTRDAWVALNALAAESRLGVPDFPERAGDLGPDEWYEVPSSR